MAEARRSDEEWQAYLQGEPEDALAELFSAFRDRLRLAVELRMNPKLHGRLDASDVIQDTFVEARSRLASYLKNPKMAPYLWIRFLTLQRLITHYRKNVLAQARDVRRDRSLSAPADPEVSSACLAARLVDDGTTPSQAVLRIERQQRVERALEQLDPINREIIALRHFEQLTNKEVSTVLGLKPATASQRYLRALRRLKEMLKDDSEDSGAH